MRIMEIVCVKCLKEIKNGEGFYNYPSGAMCQRCGSERNPSVEKALNEELKRMAKSLRLIPSVEKALNKELKCMAKSLRNGNVRQK